MFKMYCITRLYFMNNVPYLWNGTHNYNFIITTRLEIGCALNLYVRISMYNVCYYYSAVSSPSVRSKRFTLQSGQPLFRHHFDFSGKHLASQQLCKDFESILQSSNI